MLHGVWGALTFVASGLDINGCVLSYFEGTANLHCYASCTFTTVPSLPSDDRKIEMTDIKKLNRKTFAEQKMAYTVSTPDATKLPLKIIGNLCQYVINRTRQQFTVGDLSWRGIQCRQHH